MKPDFLMTTGRHGATERRRPGRAILKLFVYLHTLGAFVSVASAVATAAEATIHIDGTARHQVMDGFGTSSHLFDDPHVFDNFNTDTRRALTRRVAAYLEENNLIETGREACRVELR